MKPAAEVEGGPSPAHGGKAGRVPKHKEGTARRFPYPPCPAQTLQASTRTMVSLKSLAVLALGALPAMAAPASDHAANPLAARQNLVEVLACVHKDWTPTCYVLRGKESCFRYW